MIFGIKEKMIILAHTLYQPPNHHHLHLHLHTLQFESNNRWQIKRNVKNNYFRLLSFIGY